MQILKKMKKMTRPRTKRLLRRSVAAAVTRTLVELTYIYPKTGDAFFTRYKGIRFIITRWTGKGFVQDQQKLLNFLDQQVRHMKEMERFHRAARCIQKLYRGFRARKEMETMRRSERQSEAEAKAESEHQERERRMQLEERDIKLQMAINRHKKDRQSREDRLILTRE